MDPRAERRLVERTQAGDRAAFQALFRAHRDRTYRLARRLTGSHADADDVLQEAWMRVMRGISAFDSRARFGTWLCRIVMHAAADHARRAGRRRHTAELGQVAEPIAAQPGSDPAEKAVARELDAALEEALGALPEDQAAALVLVAFEGMSYARAAEVQQCPEGTLAWRVAEARRRLADMLAPYLDSGGTHHEM